MPAFRSRLHPFFRVAAMLGVLAMLAPVWASFAHHPASSTTFMRLCGATGKTGGADGNGKDQGHRPAYCPICQSLQQIGGGFTPPDHIALVHFATGLIAAPARQNQLLVAHDAPPQARPRAPPTPA